MRPRGPSLGIHGSNTVETTATSLHSRAASTAASVDQSRRATVSWIAIAVNIHTPSSTKWLGQEITVRVDSESSGKLATTIAAGPGQACLKLR